MPPPGGSGGGEGVQTGSWFDEPLTEFEVEIFLIFLLPKEIL